MNKVIGTVICAGIIIFIFCISYFYSDKSVFYYDENLTINDSDNYVAEVIDGDTFVLSSGEHVRLLCIDSPEIDSQGGIEAKEYLENIILNEQVVLEFDVEDKDIYGRLLRYVYFNGILVNKQMVDEGYASVFIYGNNTRLCDEIL